MHCLNVRDDQQDRIAVVTVIGENSKTRDLIKNANGSFTIGESTPLIGTCLTSHYLFSDKNFMVGCQTESGEYSKHNLLVSNSPTAPYFDPNYQNKSMKFG